MKIMLILIKKLYLYFKLVSNYTRYNFQNGLWYVKIEIPKGVSTPQQTLSLVVLYWQAFDITWLKQFLEKALLTPSFHNQL
jgi:hypothetical protein